VAIVKNLDQKSQDNLTENEHFFKENISKVLISVPFLDALFKKDIDFRKSPLFHYGRSSVKLYHVTRSDILATIALFISCNTVGEIKEITINRLYEKRVKPLFGTYFSYQEFILSIHKFQELQLVELSSNSITKKTNIKINYFLQEGSNSSFPRPERYVTLHPFIFEEEFLRQSIDIWKIYLRYIVQCNNNPNPRYYYFNQSKENFISFLQSSDLLSFLHKRENHQVKKVFEKITSLEIQEGKGPLFTSSGNGPLFVKRFNKFHEVGIRINENYLVSKQDIKTSSARFPLTPEETYVRESNFIRSYLESIGAGELFNTELKGKYSGSLARNLVYRLKSYSKSLIRLALDELAAEFKMFSRIPNNLDAFISNAIRFKKQTEFKKVLRKENLYPLLVKGWHGPDKENRIFDFLNAVSPLKMNEFKAFCRHGYKSLQAAYEVSKVEEAHYECCPRISHIPGVDLLRRTAYKLDVDPLAYQEQEEQLEKLLPHAKDSTEEGNLIHTIFKRLVGLKKHESKTILISKVKLENLLMDEWLKSGSKLFQKRIEKVYYNIKSLKISL
jgi:hypothetical protein